VSIPRLKQTRFAAVAKAEFLDGVLQL
jgi:hypothetical protein